MERLTSEERDKIVKRHQPHIFTVRTYKNLMTAVGLMDYEKAFGYLAHMEDQKLSPANVYPTLIEICMKHARKNPTDNKAWALAMKTLRDMHVINREPEGSLYANMFNHAVNTHRAKDSVELLQIMSERSHILDHGQLLDALCLAANVANAILAQELHAMAEFSNRVIPVYNLFGIIRAYVNSGVPSLAIPVVESMAEREIDRQSVLHPSVALAPTVASGGNLEGIIVAMMDYHTAKNDLPTATLACVAQAFSSQQSQPPTDALKVFMSLFTSPTYKPLLKGLPGDEIARVLGSLTRWQRHHHGVAIFRALADLPTAFHPQVLYRMLYLTNSAYGYDPSIVAESIDTLVQTANLKKTTDPKALANFASLTNEQQSVLKQQLEQLDVFAKACDRPNSMSVLRPLFEALASKD